MPHPCPAPQNIAVEAYRVRDFCRVYGIGKSLLYKLIADGKIRSVKIAGRTVIPRSEGDRLLAGEVSRAA
ncbi:MAG: helix-turn-helix domain-containing protein [Gammaproteobacteria bacterium]